MTLLEDSIQKMTGKAYFVMFSKQVLEEQRKFITHKVTSKHPNKKVRANVLKMYLNNVAQTFLFSMLTLKNVLVAIILFLVGSNSKSVFRQVWLEYIFSFWMIIKVQGEFTKANTSLHTFALPKGTTVRDMMSLSITQVGKSMKLIYSLQSGHRLS